MKIWALDTSRHVEMAGILPTAQISFAIAITNAMDIIAYLTIMCAMVDKIVHWVMMREPVLTDVALVCSDVMTQQYAYIITFVA